MSYNITKLGSYIRIDKLNTSNLLIESNMIDLKGSNLYLQSPSSSDIQLTTLSGKSVFLSFSEFREDLSGNLLPSGYLNVLDAYNDLVSYINQININSLVNVPQSYSGTIVLNSNQL